MTTAISDVSTRNYAIRLRYAAGGWYARELAAQFGISTPNVIHVLKAKDCGYHRLSKYRNDGLQPAIDQLLTRNRLDVRKLDPTRTRAAA